ncbi:MAG: alkane 1-monooxygenase, partial [Bacteroidota bacterium]
SAFLLPALTVAGSLMGGWWTLSTIAFIFLFIPIADALVGVDRNNLSEPERSAASEDLYFRLVTWIWVPVQFLFLGWAILRICTIGTLNSPETLLLLVNTGLVTGGIGITVAHELGHKYNAFEQFLSKALLLTVSYMHFFIEHNRGHHVHVATQ